MGDVFISYRREDLQLIHELKSILNVRGVSIWWDQDKLSAGQRRRLSPGP
ncbi:Hypothetical protein NGAL_HAMBI2605_62470 [Neorhizobium galegae bv. orientalis]|nr:TIR domain-containing protein [Neorhizobium galegae]CDZ64271.1 Hypothetical protein NGAL_HAMBI2566_59700 [Neorhizobium galegae bv. orientalis]CDZ67964.1 Hypothetical protein NGAL_HAMBI2605_62470 [Neorhizobium galegae bv. orientalis]